ncbi:MAG: DUF3995 domain-containing protein [Ginsengibacter sp.]
MPLLIPILLFLVFTFLSAIHFYWSVGGRWGSQSVFPTKDDSIKPLKPGFIPTIIVALGLLAMGVFILIQTGLSNLSLPSSIDEYGLWIIAGIFIVRAIGDFNYVGFFKKVRHTKFGKNDSKYYSPLCLAIGILTIIMVLTK